MLIGNSQYSRNFEKKKDYECPFTIVYDLEVLSANYKYDFGLMNPNNVSAAYIEWGDGSFENMKSSGQYFSKFTHTYSTPGIYQVKFRMNSNLNLALSSFFLVSPPSSTISNSIESIFDFSPTLNLTKKNKITIQDFNYTEFGDALSLSYTNPFYGTEQTKISNNLIHKIKKSRNIDAYNALSFANMKSSSRDLVMPHKNDTKRKYLNHSLNFNNLQNLPTPYYSSEGAFYNASMSSLRNLNNISLSAYMFESATLNSQIDINPSTEAKIGVSCFMNNDSIREVTCSNNLKYIDDLAFYYCTRLQKINLPSVIKIGEEAFRQDMNLSSFYAPKLEELEDYAFTGMNVVNAKLDLNLPNLTKCGNEVFYHNGNIRSIDFPLLKELGDKSFYECYNITHANIPSVSAIGSSCFFTNTSLSSVNAPNVESMGKFAFAYSSNLLEFSSDKLTYLDRSFELCSSLSSINFPNLETIGNLAFAACGLRVVDLPKAQTIGQNAFLQNFNLISASIPACSSIEEGGFESCSALIGVYSPSLEHVKTGAFANCSSLVSFDGSTLTGTLETSCFANCISLRAIDLSNIEQVGTNSFSNCVNLSSITFENLKTIGSENFKGTRNLKEINLPSSVNFIGNSNFENSALTGITLASIPDIITSGAFRLNNCTAPKVHITLPWSEGEILGYPWGANSKAEFEYLGIIHEGGQEYASIMPDMNNQIFYLPLSSDFKEYARDMQPYFIPNNSVSANITFQELSGKACAFLPGCASGRDIGNRSSAICGMQFKDFDDLQDYTGDVSISMWFCPTYDSTAGKFYTYLRLGPKTNKNRSLNLGGKTNKHIYAGNEGKDIGDQAAYGNVIDWSNQSSKWWHHVVTYNSTTNHISVYLDNIRRGYEMITTENGVSVLKLNMGSDYLMFGFTNRQCDPRYVHDIRVFKSCLSKENVAWLYSHNC